MCVLYDTYVRYLTAVCARYISDDDDLKDVLQEAFVRVYTAIGDFEYRGAGSLRGWLSRIAVNQALKHLRDDKMLRVPLDGACDDLTDDTPDTDDIPSEVIYEMIRQLPTGYRAVFNLYVIEDYSHREISQMLGISESTSASQLHRAKALLAARIREYRNNAIK